MNEEDLSIDAPTPPKPTIGEKLRQAREAKGLEIVQTAEQSKIKVSFLQFLENDEFNRLPNLLTAKGFAKVYAALLGLNVEEIVQQFNQQFPGEAGPEQNKEIKVGMAVDKRTLFPNGLKNMNRTGSITRTARNRYPGRSNKKNNKLLWQIIGIAALVALVLTGSTIYFRNTMSDIKNHDLRQQSDSDKLEAKETPETQARKEYDKNKIYIEATALKDTYVTLTTMVDGQAKSQGLMLHRGDFKSWDGSQYIRLRASVTNSLRLIVNGKNEGVLAENEKMFLTTAGETTLNTEENEEPKQVTANARPSNNAAMLPAQPTAPAQAATSILENI